MATFSDWLKGRGGYINPKINLFHQTGSGDRGVVAKESVSEGEQLILVPVPSTLHLDVGDITDKTAVIPATCSTAVSAFLKQQQPPFSSFLATTLMLLAELAAGADSAFEPYLGTLPQATDCLLNWSEEEKLLLAGTSLETAGRSIESIFTADILPQLQAAPDVFPAACCTYAAFRRAADMVQTRAFHMAADNWITGASQESTDELYLIPGIDMLNHATDPAARNTSLALFRGEVEVTLGNGQKKKFRDFFSMKAERDIPVGAQILHTYGDLADAQLLQTYGFIDVPPAAAAALEKPSSQHKAAETAPNPHNYVVVPVSVLLDAVKVVAAAAHLWPAKDTKRWAAGSVGVTEEQKLGKDFRRRIGGTFVASKDGKELLSSKLPYLASVGLLQQDAPEDTQLLVTAAAPLSDALLTVTQVLLMTADELQQLQQADQEQEDAAVQKTLDLGRDLLQGEFGELVGTVLLQVAAACLKRYPVDAAALATIIAAEDAGSRTWLAATVGLREQQLLLQLKKAALQLMVEANQTGDDEDDDELDSEVDSEDGGNSEPDAELDVEDSERPKKKCRESGKAADDKQKSTKHGSIKPAVGELPQQQQPQDKKHKHHHKKVDKHGLHKKSKCSSTSSSKGKKDSRPHYGAMTGPPEEDVWQSDDSDKVGYSSDEEKGDRHPPDPSEHHTYEVGATGAVREVHGRMVGPEEADLIESDDSDKVGYGDDGSDGVAARSAADGSTKRSRGGSGSSRGGSKKPKKGLGFKD